MIRFVAILLLLSVSVLYADEPTPESIPAVKPAIVFPVLPTPDKVPVAPTPPADPDAVPSLAYGQVYVVQSDVDFILLASPANLVAITPPSAGPITVRGLFADGPGKIETRTFRSKYVAFVDAVEQASGRVELIAIPVGVTDESSVTRQLVDLGLGPQPPPGPVDPVDPVNPPVVVPTGFRVMFIYEASTAMTREQLHIFNSTKIREYLTAKCAKSAELNQPEWRFWDKDIKVTSKESKTMADMFTALKPEFGNLPLIAIHANGQGRVFPWPESEAATLALLQTYGGE